MAIDIYQSTLDGGVTPTCNKCGVKLCWDISVEDYKMAQPFWNRWICKECNGGVALSLRDYLGVTREEIFAEESSEESGIGSIR